MMTKQSAEHAQLFCAASSQRCTWMPVINSCMNPVEGLLSSHTYTVSLILLQMCG